MDNELYEALGVSRDASAEEIRKAYKKVARENHPDVKPDDAAAAERFKKATEAYNVLKDPEKRKQYDRHGRAFEGFGGGGGGWPGGAGGPQVDIRDLFAQTGFSFDDLFGGGGPFGGGGSPFERQRPRARRGADHELEVRLPFRTAALGGKHEVAFRRDGRVERLDVTIRPGIDDGSTIRLAGQGEPGQGGGPAGDILLRIAVAPDPVFRRDGANVLLDVPITPAEAALGAKVDVPTLADGTVVVTIPAGTPSGAKLRVRGVGVPDPRGGEKGDQIVVTKIVVPTELDDELRTLYQRLAERSASPRHGLWS